MRCQDVSVQRCTICTVTHSKQKKWHIFSYMFKLQSPSKYSPFDAIHLSRCFFHCSEQVLNSLILIPSSSSAFFFVCFTCSTLAKCFPLRALFIQGDKKKITQGEEWIGRVGHGCACKSFIMKWANSLSLQKRFTEAQPLTTIPAGTLIQLGS